MKEIFKKTEKTEEEILKAEERKTKLKEIAVKAGKIVAGTLAFVGGAVLVLVAFGQADVVPVSTEDSEDTDDSIDVEVSDDEIVEDPEE